MILYAAISFIIVLFAFVENFSKKNTYVLKLFFETVLLLFAIMSGLRYKMAHDWNNYLQYFNTIGQVYKTNGLKRFGEADFEILYRAINVFVQYIGGSFSFVLVICAIIIYLAQKNAMLYWGKIQANGQNSLYNRYYFCTLLMCIWFIYFGNIFTARYVIAYAILFYSLKYAQLKDFKRFLFFVILASLFHQSALIYLIAYLIFNCDKKIITKIYVYVPVIAVLFSVFADRFLLRMLQYMPSQFVYRMKSYLEGAYKSRVSLAGILNYLLLYLIFVAFLKMKYSENKTYIKLLNMYCVGMLPYAWGIASNGIYARMAQPFMMAGLLLIPLCIQFFQKQSSRVIAFLLLVIYFIMRFWTNMSGAYLDSFVPYRSILFY